MSLCIYGGSGLGKTHLLNAIGNYALVKDPGLKVRYVTSEEFTNEFIDALQNPNQSQGQIAEFNRRYRQVDVLLIDDIQFLGGKEATLDQFFEPFIEAIMRRMAIRVSRSGGLTSTVRPDSKREMSRASKPELICTNRSRA